MKRFAIQVALWSIYVGVEFLVNLPHYPDRRELLLQTLVFLPLILLPFYFVAYVLVPRLLWRGHKMAFWIACAGVLLLVLFVRLHWTGWYWTWMYGHDFQVPLSKISKNLIRDYAVIGFAVALKIISDWESKDRQTIQLQQEKKVAELQFLRAQIHPHFLFNTLNNLYGLALQQSPHTPDSILRLSGLLDFILYECNENQISLQKEIKLIEDYIELERLRFGDRLNLCFEKEQALADVQIAPLLLLPFVENAFKHGASTTNAPVDIFINISIENGRFLCFEVKNSRPGLPENKPEQSNGIGLNNVEKRLQWIYPQKHKLVRTETPNAYIISLKIEL